MPEFGYICPLCGKGTVQPSLLENFPTAVKGLPVIIHGAVVGICDACGEQCFDPTETLRWQSMIEEAIG